MEKCNIDIDSEIEILKRCFNKKDGELFENYKVEFLKVRNQVITILTFQHESSAREHFNKLKEQKDKI